MGVNLKWAQSCDFACAIRKGNLENGAMGGVCGLKNICEVEGQERGGRKCLQGLFVTAGLALCGKTIVVVLCLVLRGHRKRLFSEGKSVHV